MIEDIKGLVVRVTEVGDFDKMLSVLTAEHGRISVYVRGAKRPSSRWLAATQLFCWGNYTLFRGKTSYSMNECTVLESFYHLRSDLTSLALATYLCEVACDVCLEESDETSMLRLTLNALWCIEENKKPLWLIKAAFELRCACIIGFLPQIGACQACGEEYGREKVTVDLLNGVMLCDTCYSNDPRRLESETGEAGLVQTVSNSVMAAMRYVITTPSQKQFSFTLEGSVAGEFSDICERYLLAHVDHGYHSLSFYKSIL